MSDARQDLFPPDADRLRRRDAGLRQATADKPSASPEAYYGAAQAAFCCSLAVFFLEAFAYNVILLGQVYPSAGYDARVLPYRVVFNTVWLLAVVSYLQAHLKDPGGVPLRWQVFVDTVGGKMPVTLARKEWQPRTATLCTKCNIPRPERAHHCLLCNKCVLRYDHHCPWINNCVGFWNHKYFLLLSGYTWLLCVFFLASAAPVLPRVASAAMSIEASPDWAEEPLSPPEAASLLLFVLLALCALVLLSAVIRVHFPLAMQNSTTVEDFYDNMSNPFDQGDIITNLSQIFGRPGPDWLLPVAPWRPLTDGVTFPGLPGELSEREGRDLSNVSMKTKSRFMVGDEEMVVEELWRLRYHVRPEQQRRVERRRFPSSLFGFNLSCVSEGLRPLPSRRQLWI